MQRGSKAGGIPVQVAGSRLAYYHVRGGGMKILVLQSLFLLLAVTDGVADR